MLNLLSIVIGIVFVLLLFSLLATTIMEMLAGLLTLRGKNLLNAIRSMLGDDATQQFTDHEFFKQLAEKPNLFRAFRPKNLPPSFIRPGTFTSILMDVLQFNASAEQVYQKIQELPDGKLKEVLGFLYRESYDDMVLFRKKVEDWFNEVMERASEWYVSSVRVWLFWVGLCVALSFNVDVIGIYTNLSANATLREYLADTATKFVESAPEPKAVDSLVVNPDFYAAKDQFNTLMNENIAAIRSPLGIGWENVQWPAPAEKGQWWLYKAIGWLTTALAISLGAKFWFDLLRQLVNFRSGASTPAAATTTPPAPPAPVLTKPGSGLFESTRQPAKPASEDRSADKGDG